MKKGILFIFVIFTALMFGKERVAKVNHSVSSLQETSTDHFLPYSPIEGHSQNSPTESNVFREEIILHEVDFEGDISGWNFNNGNWVHSDADYSSPSHSVNSPDDNDSGDFASYDLFSAPIDLPLLGDDEIMHFKFMVNCDMPDFIQEDDPTTPDDESQYLADYYGVSLMDPTALAWHTTDFSPTDGNNWWCGDEEVGGYLDSWVQYLDTPSFSVPAGGALSADMRWTIESPAGAVIAGTCVDGWDQANVQISTDGGTTWMVIEGDDPYDFECGYGTVYNGYDGAPGWGGDADWHTVNFDLSSYAGQDAKLRFAFYSDPAYSTIDNAGITGFQVDNIVVSNGTFSDTGDDPDALAVSGEVWVDQFYEYGDATQPGGAGVGWTEYLPGYPFNGNAFLDISDFAGKTVVFRFQSRYDGDHYSESGAGGQGTGLWIDDFVIYKESSGSYPPPQNLVGEAGDNQVSLSWDDMNTSGNFNYIYDNDNVTNGIQMSAEGSSAWAGAEMNIAGASEVNNVSIFNINDPGTTVTIAGFSTLGSLYDNQPDYTEEVVLADAGWNTFPVGWNFNNNFILAQQFDYYVLAGLDESAQPSSHSMILFGTGGWDYWSIAGANVGDGEWGIRANVDTEGANVTYNIYRDGSQVISGLTSNQFTDDGVENNTAYEYAATATYSDGEESGYSNVVEVTPYPQTVHEVMIDDGTAEGSFNAGSANYCAVKLNANNAGEDVMKFKWYQTEDGGAFYLRLWADSPNGPAEQLFSTIVASGLMTGWNEKDLSTQGLSVSGDFWVGVKEFSSTKPFGIDSSSDEGVSFYSNDDWMTNSPVSGNLMFRIFLDEGDGQGGGDCTSDDYGDVNADAMINVLDIVSVVNFIMGTSTPDAYQACASDVNGDGVLNVLDIVSIVNIIMGN